MNKAKEAMTQLNILVTGATGFVGRSLVDELLLQKKFSVSALIRNKKSRLPDAVTKINVIDLTAAHNWCPILNNIDVLVHVAGRAHIMKDTVANSLAEFRKVNTHGTLNLARQAAKAGVKRFIFISSIKVSGESTQTVPFSPDQLPSPQDPYGVSKYEAEEGLKQLALDAGMEVVIIRPPLIYGSGVKGNLQSLAKVIKKGIPLPFGAIHNRRSLVSIDNLCDLIITCIDHPKAANQTFLVSDDRPLSTTELIKMMAFGLGVKARLLPIPVPLMRWGMNALGKADLASRLFGNLEVDISHTKSTLNWIPPYSVEDSFTKMFKSS